MSVFALRLEEPSLAVCAMAIARLALRPALRLARGFSTRPERVVSAVERYLKARKDDLLRDGEAEHREEALKALDSKVSTETKWEALKFDDIDRVEVLLEVEDEFSHVIPDADADSINSVQDILSYLEKANVE